MKSFVTQFVAVLLLLPGLPVADSTAQNRTTTGTKRAIVICGHPGDDEHRQLFAGTIESLQKSLTEHYGFSSGEIQILFGGETTEADAEKPSSAYNKSTRESIESAVKALREKLKSEDSLWVVVLGHAHFDGRRSWLNLPGPDIHELDFAALFKDLTAREQVFLITTPVSGFFIRPLSQKRRVVISATEADREVNETVFHSALVEALGELPQKKGHDLDGDGQASLFELYIAITRNVADGYLEDELLSTEHAQLDDNGDARGTELQLDYLTVEQGGRAEEGTKPPRFAAGSDGFLANGIKLTAIKIPQPQADEKTEQDSDQ